MKRNLMLLLVSVPLAVATGCGDDSDTRAPPSSHPASSAVAARVGATTVSEADVLHVQPLVAPVSTTNGSGVAKPPLFTDCIAASRALNNDASPAAMRKACKRQFEQNKVYAAGYLIKRTWSMLEAKRRGLEPSQAVGRERLRTQLQSGDRAVERRVLATDRDRRALTAAARTQTRDLRLAKAMHVEIGEPLGRVLLRRYKKQTTCAPKYKKAGIPECNGSTQNY